MSAQRRSPLLGCLPRCEVGVEAPEAVVKLRTTIHGGASREGRREAFSQLTVPSGIADELPAGVKFAVSFDGAEITYRRLDV